MNRHTKKESDQIVFLSSSVKDLLQYRESVYNAIKKLKGFKCIRMEDFTAQPNSPLDYIKTQIPKCSLFIGLIGVCYGSIPNNKSKSFTELEYDKAKEKKIPCLMFITPDDISIPANIVREDENWEKQKRFRKKVKSKNICVEFKNPGELANEVVLAIRNWELKSLSIQSPKKKIDCIILSGGYSTRLWPLTNDLSKHLLLVGGKPVLWHALDFVKKSNLIKNIYLLTNQKFASHTKNFLRDYRAYSPCKNVRVMVDPEDNLGPVGALQYAFTNTNLQENDYLIIGGDNLFGFKLEEFLNFAISKDSSSNAVHLFQKKESVSEYGVAILDANNKIIGIQEKQKIFDYRRISTACYFLKQKDVDLISKYINSGGNPHSLGTFIHWLSKEGPSLLGFKFESFWYDIGTKEKMLQANWQFLNEVRLGEQRGTNKIEGPAQIEPNSFIESSIVGPNVYIGSGAKILNSEVHNSIILDGSIIRNSKIMYSIVGPKSEIEGSLFESVCGPNTNIISNIKS